MNDTSIIQLLRNYQSIHELLRKVFDVQSFGLWTFWEVSQSDNISAHLILSGNYEVAIIFCKNETSYNMLLIMSLTKSRILFQNIIQCNKFFIMFWFFFYLFFLFQIKNTRPSLYLKKIHFRQQKVVVNVLFWDNLQQYYFYFA